MEFHELAELKFSASSPSTGAFSELVMYPVIGTNIKRNTSDTACLTRHGFKACAGLMTSCVSKGLL